MLVVGWGKVVLASPVFQERKPGKTRETPSFRGGELSLAFLPPVPRTPTWARDGPPGLWHPVHVLNPGQETAFDFPEFPASHPVPRCFHTSLPWLRSDPTTY